MNKFLDYIDKHKFGILAAITAYLIIFVYTQLPSIEYNTYGDSVVYQADVEIPEDDITLKPENIKVDFSIAKEIINASRDENDTRKQSEKNWTENKNMSQVEKSVYELEKQFYEEAGGSKEREKIQKEIDKKKAELEAEKSKSKVKPDQTNGKPGGENSPPPNVLASWNLKNRTNQALPKPGYLCPQGTSGKVTVRIKVDQNGYVIEARIDPSLSTAMISCMAENAESYAKRARFNISSTAPAIQEGTITYTYVP